MLLPTAAFVFVLTMVLCKAFQVHAILAQLIRLLKTVCGRVQTLFD